MKRDYQLYLRDIISAMESIRSFTADMQYEAFRADDKTSSAVIRKLEIIGEAAKQIPAEFRRKYPQIPWKEMAGMRDRLIHPGYAESPSGLQTLDQAEFCFRASCTNDKSIRS